MGTRCADLLGAVPVPSPAHPITGNEEVIEQALCVSGGVTVFFDWEFYAPVTRNPQPI